MKIAIVDDEVHWIKILNNMWKTILKDGKSL